ncbi:hypothetical protein M0R45_026868 [Rubus argutus]|uniref:DUF7812 domain-containing protein n=1 Tax=Rubus argutus TaxID=59490 RepID=A0AAW1X0F7_RUBAR
MEKTQFLLSVLGKLIALITSGCDVKESVSFRKFVSCECTYTDTGGTYVSEDFVASLCFLEPSNPWHPVLCAVLEIFADELLMRRLLRNKNFRGPELSLTAALPLLLNPIMLSAPKMLQTHLILLVSEAIDIDSLKNARPDLRLMDCYLTAFERSVVLYTSHMSSSLMDHHPLGVICSHGNSCMLGSYHPSFESCIQQGTREKIFDRVSHIDSLRQLTKSDLMASSTAYINKNQHIFDESCKDDSLSVLQSIILGGLSSDVNHNVFYRKGDSNSQDIYLLASILKLMSSSLMKVNLVLRNGGTLRYPQTLKDTSSLKEYDFVLGLLSLSFASGIDFLVKGCISIIMAILNLCAFEEGDMVALRSLLDSGSQSVSSELSPDKGVKKQKSIRKVASNFQNIQNVYLSKHSVTSCHKRAQGEVAKTSENACFMSCTREFTDVIERKQKKPATGRCTSIATSRLPEI